MITRILVIDDQPEIREIMLRILKGAGYEVETATDGVAGLRRFKQAPFDLIITDLVMPDKEGIETIMEVRSFDRKVKIIAISGYTDLPYLDMARQLGANRVLPKPCSRQVILDTIQSLLAEDSPPTSPIQATPA